MSTNKLAGFTLKELQEEIECRRNIRPERIVFTNWTTVANVVMVAIDSVHRGDGVPKDFEQQLLETVLETMYGKDIFKWWNTKLRAQ
jgi:hypothetical protein